jgi:uncharacterized membrane protein YraQ (UPF0718 family)
MPGVLLGLVIGTFILFVLDRGKSVSAALTAKRYLVEMLSILPPILVLLGLFESWVPKTWVEKAMGPGSGTRGAVVSVLVGTAAMGPLYVAFPVGLALLKKGASLFNVCVFLCVWASIKIPMILFEVKFLGVEFSLLRLVLTVPAILVISGLMNILRMNIPERRRL